MYEAVAAVLHAFSVTEAVDAGDGVIQSSLLLAYNEFSPRLNFGRVDKVKRVSLMGRPRV